MSKHQPKSTAKQHLQREAGDPRTTRKTLVALPLGLEKVSLCTSPLSPIFPDLLPALHVNPSMSAPSCAIYGSSVIHAAGAWRDRNGNEPERVHVMEHVSRCMYAVIHDAGFTTCFTTVVTLCFSLYGFLTTDNYLNGRWFSKIYWMLWKLTAWRWCEFDNNSKVWCCDHWIGERKQQYC